MAQASLTERVQVSADQMYRVITDYDRYPQFLVMCKSVSAQRKSPTEAEVAYVLDLFTNVQYSTRQVEDPANKTVHWDLITSNIFKKNTGSWKLREISPTLTEAKYELDLEFKVPVPGFILKKLVQVTLPEMMKAFTKTAEAAARSGQR